MDQDQNREEFENKYQPVLQNMSVEQLIWLNEMVIDYVKIKEDFQYKSTIRNFNRGDKVKWEKDGVNYKGWVIKTNKKTVNVAEIEAPHRQWKIDPNFLYKEK